jgi:hypothetical protein
MPVFLFYYLERGHLLAQAIARHLAPRLMIGCSAEGIIAEHDDLEAVPATRHGGCWITEATSVAVHPARSGAYFYADRCAGFINSARLTRTQAQEHVTWPHAGVVSNVTNSTPAWSFLTKHGQGRLAQDPEGTEKPHHHREGDRSADAGKQDGRLKRPRQIKNGGEHRPRQGTGEAAA